MPVIDKPLKELLLYTGSSPRPADFDAFWKRALSELETVDARLEWADTDFSASYAQCRSLRFTGVGGARLHAKIAQPTAPSEKPGPAVVMFHGYSGSAPSWMDMLPYVAAGFTVVGLDCRGQGGLSEDTVPVRGNTLHGHIIKGIDDEPDKLYYRNVFLDTVQLARIAMSLDGVDETRVATWGGSQGGALSLACAALEPRICKCFTMYPFLCDYRRVWEMDLDQRAYEGLRHYFRRFDPLHEREDAVFEKLGYIDVVNLAPRIKAEVLMAITLMDDICPPSTQFAAYNGIPSKKSKLVYPDYGHEGLPGAAEACFKFFADLL